MDDGAIQSALITGASGFIGHHLVRRLAEKNCEVTCLVRHASQVDELRAAGVNCVVGNLGDSAGIAEAVSACQPQVVFHLAGLIKALSPAEFMSVNRDAAGFVAAACAGQSYPPTLVLVSSLAAAGPSATNEPYCEKDVPRPISDYGRSKLAGEQTAIQYADRVPITIVRPPIVFGSGDRGTFEIFRPIARSGIHAVPGCGENRFSLVHVADLVEGLIRAAQQGERVDMNGRPGCGIYYLGADESPTYVELGYAIARALGQRPPRVVHVPKPLLRLAGRLGDRTGRLRRRAGWVNSDKITEALAGSWTCSPAKARQQLGWSPAATLAARLEETARWYREARWI